MEKDREKIGLTEKGILFVLCIAIPFLIPSLLYGGRSWISFGKGTKEGGSPRIIALQSSGSQTVVDIKVPGMWRSQVTTHGHSFDILNIPGYGSTGELGKARVPAIGKLVAIPPTSGVSLEVVSAHYIDLKGYNVYPSQMRFWGHSDTPWYYDEEFYDEDAFYPSVVAEISAPGILRDCRVVRLTVYPVAFNPVVDELRVYNHIVLRLDHQGTSSRKGLDRARSTISREQARIYRDLIVNFGYLNFEESDTVHKRYLIITDPHFATSLASLREWKQKKGIETKTAFVGECQGCISRDAAAIRDYIKSFFYENDRADTYLLLVGDPDIIGDDHSVPMCSLGFDPFPVWSDHLYSCIDDTDYYPDIQVGRISPSQTTILDDAAIVDTIARRTVRYETNPPPGPWTSTHILAAWQCWIEDEYDQGDFTEIKDCAIPLLVGYGAIVETVFTWGSQWEDLKSYLENGATTLNCLSHGDSANLHIWRCPWTSPWTFPYSWTTEDALSLQNGDMRPVVYAYSCATATIQENKPCLAEAFMSAPKGGAIGYFGASIEVARANALTFGDISWYKATFPDNPESTRIYTVGKIHNYTDCVLLDCLWSPLDGMTVNSLLWLGDPELSLWTAEPDSFTVEHPHFIPLDVYSCSVTVKSNELGVKEARVCLYKPDADSIHEIGYSDESGLAVFQIHPQNLGKMYVTVTKQTFLPYQGDCFCGDLQQNYFIRGDYDGSGQMLINDPLMELQWIFAETGAPPPSCMDAADYNDDGAILTNDPLMALQRIFGVPGSTDPSPPYPNCGPDPTTEDALNCIYHEFCMDCRALAYKPSVTVKGAENKLVVGEITLVDGVVRVPVELTVTEAVCGFDISLGYDASCLRFKETVSWDEYDFYAVDTRQEGVVRIGGVPDIEMADLMGAGTHRVAEILFTVERKIDSELNWRNVEVYGANVEALPVEWIGGLVKAGVDLPTEFALSQNYPNPFNPVTRINYALPRDCRVKLEVFNIGGQKIVTLVDESQEAGYKSTFWDGRDKYGRQASSGIYFYHLQTDYFSDTKKLVIIR